MPVYASAKNPLVIDGGGKPLDRGKLRIIMDRAFRKGHDSVQFKKVLDAPDIQGATPATVWAFKAPYQIKSATGNKGVFDLNFPKVSMPGEDRVKPTGRASYMPGDAAPAQTAGAGDETEKARAAWRSQGTDSPYFKRWFGNSKAVDDNGKPVRVYHGTGSNFEAFEPNKTWSGTPGTVFTSTNPEVGSDFADHVSRFQSEPNASVMPLYAKIENPLTVDMGASEHGQSTGLRRIRDLIKQAKAEGHDGLNLKNIIDSPRGTIGDHWIGFKPEQFKSATGNIGTFDAKSGKVNYMPGEAAPGEDREPITIKRPFDQTRPVYSRPDRAFFMPGDDTVPVTFTKNKRGEDTPVKIGYDIVHAPLIAGKQPTAEEFKNAVDTLPKDQYKYLTDAARRRLSALDKASATTTFGNKLAAEARKVMKDPEVAAGVGWYSRLRDLLSQSFGKDHELFSHLLGVTSPMENPVSNFLYALEAYQKFKNGDYDRHVDLYRKAYEMKKAGTLQQHVEDLIGKPTTSDAHAMSEYVQHHDITPTRDNGKLYGFHSQGILRR
jgi:ADP-Ribosyltransferase in polyvalent proteins